MIAVTLCANPEEKKEVKNVQLKVVELAQTYVDKKFKQFTYKDKNYGNDCSGFVRYLYAHFDIDIVDPKIKLDWGSGTEAIYKKYEKAGTVYTGKTPEPGDIITFDNTYDRNNDGKVNDPFSHTALVEKVLDDGTVVMIHNINSVMGVRRDKMNLGDPDNYKVNSYIRSKRRYPHPDKKYLTGQLFHSFAKVQP